MSEIKDGGPAFPHEERAVWGERAGMSLRDYFAAKAMAALLSNNWPVGIETSESAYTMADCMLRARGLK